MLALLAAAYVGSGACAPCHPEILRKYLETPMARSSGKAGAETIPGQLTHQPSGAKYSIDVGKNEVLLRYRAGQAQGVRRLEYFLGSGTAGRTYLFSEDRFLYEAPVTWYATGRRWDMSPGYSADTEVRLDRPVEPRCLFCHASSLKPIYGTVNRYAEVPFAENGVSCERCHGPGGDHVRGKGALVNPAKLDPARRDAICQQCHLTGEVEIARAGWNAGQFRSRFQPGKLLSESMAVFTGSAVAGSAVKATSHVERFLQSRCRQASGDRLWCGTCHDPHSTPEPAGVKQFYRAKCENCHQAGDRQCERGPDCVGCHMPKSKVADGGHGMLSDHSISRRPDTERKVQAASVPQPFAGFPAGAREIGLAYAELAAAQGKPELLTAARRLLQDASDSGASDPLLFSRLAWTEQRMGENETAIVSYRKALEQEPWSAFVLGNLGVLEARRGRLDEAIGLWRRGLKADPANHEILVNLRDTLQRLGRDEGAKAAAERVDHYRPSVQGR